MKLTEQQKEIALRIADEVFTGYCEDGSEILQFAARFLAALPKPEPFGWFNPDQLEDPESFGIFVAFQKSYKDNTPLYNTPPQPDDVRDAWQPIETAPKDGTEILCVTKVGIMVLFWDTGFWREKASFLGLRTDPTHWMPLPEAPAIAAAKGEV